MKRSSNVQIVIAHKKVEKEAWNNELIDFTIFFLKIQKCKLKINVPRHFDPCVLHSSPSSEVKFRSSFCFDAPKSLTLNFEAKKGFWWKFTAELWENYPASFAVEHLLLHLISSRDFVWNKVLYLLQIVHENSFDGNYGLIYCLVTSETTSKAMF